MTLEMRESGDWDEMTSWPGSEQSSARTWPEEAWWDQPAPAPPVCCSESWPSSLLSGVAKRPGLALPSSALSNL